MLSSSFCRVLALACACLTVVHAVYPNVAFSWDHVPVYIHMCNTSGPFNDAALQMIARYPIVTFEKGQAVFSNDSAPAEDQILAAARAIKAVRPNITVLAYFNSEIDWQYYRLHQQLVIHPSFRLVNASGGDVLIHGDPSFPQPPEGMYVYGFQTPGMVNAFVQACANLTLTGVIDGCFADRADNTSSFPKNTIDPAVMHAWQAGHDAAMQQSQAAIGARNMYVANHLVLPGVTATMIEQFNADEPSILQLMQFAAQGVAVEVHTGYSTNGADNYCTSVTNSLSAFLIGAGDYSYYGCARGWIVDPLWPQPGHPDDWLVWRPEYDLPLGKPLGPGVKTGNVWSRSFASGTNVTFNAVTNVGSISWAKQ